MIDKIYYGRGAMILMRHRDNLNNVPSLSSMTYL